MPYPTAFREDPFMLVITLVMLPIVVLAVLVVTFVAFPHRGEAVPKAPWLGEAMGNLADVLPTLDNTEEEAGAPAAGHGRAPAARQGSGLLP
jgi:hypothetical protein